MKRGPSATAANATPSATVESSKVRVTRPKPELTIVLLCSDLGLQVLGVDVLVVLVVVRRFALPAAEAAAAATAAARKQRAAENQALQQRYNFRTPYPTIHPDYAFCVFCAFLSVSMETEGPWRSNI